MWKIKIYQDKNVNNIVLNELLSLSNYLVVVDDLSRADIVAVFYPRNLIKTVNRLLAQYDHYMILIEMTAYDFKSNRVFMINSKLRDNCIVNFKNNFYGLDIVHVDITLIHYEMNLRAEVMNSLLLVGDIVGWYHYEQLQLRFSYNDHSVHVSGYDRERNFTLSIFISNTGIDFDETITVYTRHDGIFKLDSDLHDHSYGERYGAAIQKIVMETISQNLYYQRNIPLVIKSCVTDSSRPSTKKNSRSTFGVNNNIPLDNVGALLRNVKSGSCR